MQLFFYPLTLLALAIPIYGVPLHYRAPGAIVLSPALDEHSYNPPHLVSQVVIPSAKVHDCRDNASKSPRFSFGIPLHQTIWSE